MTGTFSARATCGRKIEQAGKNVDARLKAAGANKSNILDGNFCRQ